VSGAAAVEFHVAELVDAQQVDVTVAVDGLGELPVVGGPDELVGELGGQGVVCGLRSLVKLQVRYRYVLDASVVAPLRAAFPWAPGQSLLLTFTDCIVFSLVISSS